jgi:hypothetical protein
VGLFDALGFHDRKNPISRVKVRMGIEIHISCCPRCGGNIKSKNMTEGLIVACTSKVCGWKAEVIEPK